MPKADNFRARLAQYFSDARASKQAAYDRTLPFGDYVVDRWEKARQLGFGEGTSIYDNVVILGRPQVGRNVWIGPNTLLDASGGLRIDDNCNISAGVQIYSHDSIASCVSGGAAKIERAPVEIGENTYIGPNVVITKGVRIGSRCVIGAMSLVLEDIPDGWLAHGTPARARRRYEVGSREL